MTESYWEFWIDVGGTFTDCVAKKPDGTLLTTKLLSSGVLRIPFDTHTGRSVQAQELHNYPPNLFVGYTVTVPSGAHDEKWHATVLSHSVRELVFSETLPHGQFDSIEITAAEPAPILAIRILKGCPLDAPLGKLSIKLGTTRGTNALLERSGLPTCLITTSGFGDTLEIGDQTRPDLFELNIQKPAKLYDKVIEINERVNADGTVLTPLDTNELNNVFQKLYRDEYISVAICLVNAYANPIHERQLKRYAQNAGFEHISVSTELTPTINFLDRGDTCVLNAYLSPVMDTYFDSIREAIPDGTLQLITSAGALVSLDHFRARDGILSGPAGGVVGCVDAGKAAGINQLIGFDMGGTSTDVSRFEGTFNYEYRSTKAGIRIVSPTLAIETIAAGGGSICTYQNERLLVGPESAGADPGPACYGAGGPLTITDINLYTGRLPANHFPFPLDMEPPRRLLTDLLKKVHEHSPDMTLDELAHGFLKIANTKMATAIQRISLDKGIDPQTYTLVAFGGAGMQHACSVASELSINRILYHPFSAILSAYGMGLAVTTHFAEQSVAITLGVNTPKDLEPVLIEQIRETLERVLADAPHLSSPPVSTHSLDCRYQGEEATITIPYITPHQTREDFQQAHERLYGHIHAGREIHIRVVRTRTHSSHQSTPVQPPQPLATQIPIQTQSILFDGIRRETSISPIATLERAHEISGPTILTDRLTALVIEDGWIAELNSCGSVIITNKKPSAVDKDNRIDDPAELEVFNNRLTHIATQMGTVLKNTALSVNIKERLDFSCAILDSAGELIVNAPYIPVHLGAMGACVKSLLSEVSDISAGDIFLTNDPGAGGSHLPDLTVITPVFDQSNSEILFFTASRAHHSEIGGRFPGSSSPFATSLEEEGVVCRHLRIQQNNCFNEPLIREHLSSGPWPSRAVDENCADIRAAIAANNLGKHQLIDLSNKLSWKTTSHYMNRLTEVAETATRELIQTMGPVSRNVQQAFDDGAMINLRLTTDEQSMCLDFTGSAGVQTTSLNANPAIISSVALYCIRTLLHHDTPLNAGILRPVKLIIPEGMLNPPSTGKPSERAAVVGGNTEVSQRVANVLLRAFNVLGEGQGTMNNVIFGNDSFSYYETLGGGTGAGPNFPGASATHSHMTNTRVTDVEVLEQRYPVRLNEFSIRRDSGGPGTFPGGDGLVRDYEFLEPVNLSLLTQSRIQPPRGIEGGENAKTGENLLIQNSTVTELDGLCQLDLAPGDRLHIKTPGGGGYGHPTLPS